jgi:biotin synthase
MIESILNKNSFDKQDILHLLQVEGDDRTALFKKASEVRDHNIGKKVYFRGLIELSNKCSKNCLYCGIRAGNSKTNRYVVTKEEVLECAKYAYDERYGSVVIQSGERSDKAFVDFIEDILLEIKKMSNGELGVTLSLGEQTEETYRRWFNAGGHRYLLRIEASNKDLYYKIHPVDKIHDYETRLECLNILRKVGYQVGTGVMIGLPFQTLEDLADDLLFFKNLDIDMCGMGPFIEHEDTPLYKFNDLLLPKIERFNLSLKMVAILRIMMKDVNIAATTAMQTLDPAGREKAIRVGANIIMPNLTPVKYREDYLLYEDKPCLDEEAWECKSCLEARIKVAGAEIGYGEWGDSKHFDSRNLK